MGFDKQLVTYLQLGSGSSSLIDQFCVTKSLFNKIVKSFIIENTGSENLSDHLALRLVLTVDDAIANMSDTAATLIGRKRLQYVMIC